MQAIHSIQVVSGPNVTVAVPRNFHGLKVEIVIKPVEATEALSEKQDWEEDESIFMDLPDLSDEMKKRLADDPTYMQRSVLRCDDPFGPACPIEDWEANS